MRDLVSSALPRSVDLHSHILPAIGDGARSFDEAVQMLRMAAAGGTTDIVATPHFDVQYSPSRWSVFEAIAELRERAGDEITIHHGFEVFADRQNLAAVLAKPDAWTIGSTAYILIEFSDGTSRLEASRMISLLKQAGLRPVIAHPERNPVLRGSHELLLDWFDRGVVFQLTAGSFFGRFGAQAKEAAIWLVQRRLAHVIASDAHDVQDRSPLSANDRDGLIKMLGRTTADVLLTTNPSAILANADVTNMARANPSWITSLISAMVPKHFSRHA